ncbi:4-hydroxy-tetrahydrodipicolinate synthase [Olleya sp.]|jgi:4-hydroxy-tetrahydrodipicolinate synthase|uniref:4-hydroxy-tetrahydrodipicolinate synthase n=1 Tax=Olleya sp. TaxID=1906788 RepID=UPI0032D98221
MNNPFLGTGIAIVTPFNDDLSVDYKALENIVEYNITNGINYIVINGTTGESVTITKQEKQDIVAAIIKYNKGRVPLVLGIGGSNTAQVVEEIKATDFTGIAGILSVSPYYSKPTQEGMYQHFRAIAQVCPIDIILYNVPGRTSKNMTPETTLRLAKDFDNIVAVKEAGNNVAQYLELLRDKPDNFSVISGDDDLALGIVLAGGAGVISVIGQGLPKAFSTMINLGLEGKNKEAYQLHFKMMDIVNMIFEENNPAGIKAVLNSLELCNTTVRLPLVTATTQLQSRLNTFMTNFSKS